MRLARCTPTRRCLVDIGYSFAPPQCVRGGVRWRVARYRCPAPATGLRGLGGVFLQLPHPIIRPPSAPRLRRACSTPTAGLRSRRRSGPPATQYRTPGWQGLVPGVVGETLRWRTAHLVCAARLAHRTSLIGPRTMHRPPCHRTAAQLPSTSQPTAHVRHSRPPMSSQEPQPKPGRPDPTIPGAPPPLTRTRT